MTILSAQSIRRRKILDPFLEPTKFQGTSVGLSAAGYDLTLVLPRKGYLQGKYRDERGISLVLPAGGFLLAAAMERFEMPNDLVGKVRDKSTWARRGVFLGATIIEPGWRGWLTLEIVNQSDVAVELIEGQGIAQVMFETLDEPTEVPYGGKYQDQEWGPQEARS